MHLPYKEDDVGSSPTLPTKFMLERLKINLNNQHSVGLGDNLCLLSALANLPVGVDLHTTNDHNTFNRLTQYKKIFRIPDQLLSISESDQPGNFNNTGWPLKFFSEYYRPGVVNVNGQNIRIHTPDKEKKCIAIAGSFELDGKLDEWPWCRARPLDYWTRIVHYVKQMGFDVITVDYAFHDLEDKIELLAKHCRAIISYEGGMAHLSHMLKVPCFLVNWRLPSPSTTLGQFHCEFVHKTDNVYILRDDEELFSWDKDTFYRMMNDLAVGKTNNRLVNGNCSVEFVGPGPRGEVTVKDSTGRVMLKAPPIFGVNLVADVLEKYHFTEFWQNSPKNR